MTDASGGERVLARCNSCGRRYRVPATGRTYRCKACGGTVHAEGAGEPPAAPAPARPTPRPADTPASRAERVAAKRDVYAATRAIRRVRLFLGLAATLHGFVTLILLRIALAGESAELDLADAERNALWLVFGVGAAATALLITAIVRVKREPFPWTVTAAGLATVEVFLAPTCIQFALCVAFWLLLVPLVRVRRTLREHPELFLSRYFEGERRGAGGSEASARARERRAASRRAARRTRWVAIGGTLGIAAVVVLGWFFLTRPGPLEPVARRLAEAWSGEGPVAAGDFFPPSERDGKRAVLERDAAVRGWEEGAPELVFVAVEDEPAAGSGDGTPRRKASYELAGEPVSTVWEHAGGSWRLVDLRLPFLDLAERFRDAWNAGGVERVAAFYSDAESAASALAGLVRRRDWDTLPAIEDFELDERSDTRLRMDARTSAGGLEVRWSLVDDRWCVRALKPPRGG